MKLASLLLTLLYVAVLTEQRPSEKCFWTNCMSYPQCANGFAENAWEDCQWDEYMSFKKSYCCPKTWNDRNEFPHISLS
ncbi:hypothetical protein QR680_014447 [Steinernema hermaphroditum]|uniref:Uncharacterized protein n=1 Tax=Steinernema hermaphroditum TaxID=289476 RepID=A0AA39I8X7_9BILA|nr:hypothetical protein QR680_014447 [Steinernema hermaphroditum]